MATVRAGRTLTPQQDLAIATRESSIALSAGAGCGKTFVLTERFLAHLEPLDGQIDADELRSNRLDQLIAITFTRRAAGEMRDRIRRACHDRLLTSAASEEAEHWLALARGLHCARISTIDSFCAAFLRSHAVEAEVDPAFRVMDAAQSTSLRTEAIDNQLRQMLASSDESLVILAADFGLARIRETIRSLLDSREAIDFSKWLGRSPAETVRIWQQFRDEQCLPRLLRNLADAPEAQRVMNLLAQVETDSHVLREVQGVVLASWDSLSDPSPFEAVTVLRDHANVKRAGLTRPLKDLGIYEPVRDGFRKIRELADRVLACRDWNPDEALESAEAGQRLLRVLAAVDAEYAKLKQDSAVLDFPDLVRKSRDLLRDERHAPLRQTIAADIELLLVDEFQDTDPVQAELVETLCGDRLATGRLFFVGDAKQSIYRFRGADPSVFARLRGQTPTAGRLPLTENFRSQPAILDFVNAVFCESMSPDYEPLQPTRPQIAPEPAVEFLWAAPADGEDDSATALRKLEADWVARRIRQLIDAESPCVWDAEAAAAGVPRARPPRQGDVAILFRALSDVQHYENALRKYELDYYLVGGHAFYAQQEVFDLLNLLRALGSPADAVALAGVLRSPFFSLDDETLFWLAQDAGGLSAGLFRTAPYRKLSPQQRGRAEFARDVLKELRSAKDRLPVAALIERSLELTGYDALLLTEFLGQRKLANLRKLIEQARSFDSSGICTLAEFVIQLDEFVSRQPHESMAATQAENDDVIRLMTIHQAKGLEFPIVVVPDLQRLGQTRREASYSSQLGPLLSLPEELYGRKLASGRELFAIVEDEEEQAESARLLYVATTRAADYLLLSAGVKEVGAASSPWLKLLAGRFDLASGDTRSRLPENYPAPRISVTRVRPELGERFAARRHRTDLAAVVAKAEQLAARSGERPKPAPEGVGPVAIKPGGRHQYSFSELSGALEEGAPTTDWERQQFSGDARTRLDAQRLGILVHAVLAELPRRQNIDVRARARHLAELLPSSPDDPLTDREALERQAVALVERFRQSQRFAMLRDAVELHTEIELLLAWPPQGKQKLLLPAEESFRGFIDCLYRDGEGKWHLLDYKTNAVDAAGVPALGRAYEMQMMLYALAVEQAVGEPPATLCLSFLQPGVELEIPFTASTRSLAISKIDAALASFRAGPAEMK